MKEAPYPHELGVPRGYRECPSGQTAILMTKAVQDYLDRHPESKTYSPNIVVIQALQEMCAPYRPSRYSKKLWVAPTPDIRGIGRQ